jgi:hypothetical protein
MRRSVGCGVRGADHDPGAFQPVDQLGHSPRAQQQPVAELPLSQGAGPLEVLEGVEVGRRQSEPPAEGRAEPVPLQAEPVQRGDW